MDITTVLIVAVICLVIGLFTGFLIYSLRSDKEVHNTRLEQIAEEPEEQVQGVQLYRETPDGPLQIKLDGRLFHSVYEVTPHIRNTLEESAFEFCKWLGYPLQDTDSQYGLGITPRPAAQESSTPEAAVPVEAEPLPAPAPAAKSIVSQINDILQEKVAVSPLSWRKITLVEHPNRGIVVQVGVDQYNDVDEVPDPAIRELIHTAVEEWEKRSV